MGMTFDEINKIIEQCVLAHENQSNEVRLAEERQKQIERNISSCANEMVCIINAPLLNIIDEIRSMK